MLGAIRKPLGNNRKAKTKSALQKVVLDRTALDTFTFKPFPAVVYANNEIDKGQGNARFQRDVIYHLDANRPIAASVQPRYQSGAFQRAYMVCNDFILLFLSRRKHRRHSDTMGMQAKPFLLTFEGNSTDRYSELGTVSGPDSRYKIVCCARDQRKKHASSSYTCLGEVKYVVNSYKINQHGKRTWQFEVLSTTDTTKMDQTVQNLCVDIFD